MSIEKIGPYRLGAKLGRQSRHQVYDAVHEETGEAVAIKLVNITTKVDRDFAIKRIELEAKLLKRLQHPNLVRIIDAAIEGNTLYFVMEKVDAEPLSALLGRRGKLAWDLSVDYALQIAEGLEYLHDQELLHLKVTPDKILVTPDGQVKLTDMRLNRARKRRWDDSGNRVLDTAAYLAPEQLAGEDVSIKCDMYSLGVLLFEMITGKLPFEPETLARLIQRKRFLSPPGLAAIELDTPIWLDRLVSQLISGDIARRPHSMHAVVLSLKETKKMDATRMGVAQRTAKGFNPITMGNDSAEARRLLGMETQEKPARDYSVPILATCLLLVVILLGVGIGWSMIPPKPEALLSRARELVAAGDFESLVLAERDCLKPLLERVKQGPMVEEAEELMLETRARLAGCRIEFDLVNQRPPKSRIERRCMDAWMLEEEKKYREAWDAYRAIAKDTDPESEDADFGLFAELKQRLIAEQIASGEAARKELEAELFEILNDLETDHEESIARLETVLALYGSSPQHNDLMEPARQILQRLIDERSPPTSDTTIEEAPPQTEPDSESRGKADSEGEPQNEDDSTRSPEPSDQ